MKRLNHDGLSTRSCCGLLLALLLVGTTAATARGDGDTDLAERIDALAAEALEQPGAVGLSIAVARGDEIIHARGYGLADVEHDVAMTERSILRIGSVTKQYTAAMIMNLVEDGRLSLDDPLTDYVDYPVGEYEVTIRHLLNHTSGIPSYTSVAAFWEEGASRELTDDQLLAFVRNKPFDFPPGEQYRYNNTGYYLLGMVIEQVTEKSYPEALEAMLLEPLGLGEMMYDVVAKIVPHRARGYTLRDGELANARPIGMRNPGAAGGMIATATDLVRWKHALVSGRIVSSESLDMMTSPTALADDSEHAYGFGLVLGNVHDRPCISHGGGINGFSAALMYFPDDDLHVAVLSNSEALGTNMLSIQVAAAALGLEEDALDDLPIEPELLGRLEGVYLIQQIGLMVTVTTSEGRVHAQGAGQPRVQLLYQGEGVFRAEFDPTLRFRFPVDETSPAGPMPGFTLEQAGMTFQAARVSAVNGE